jgi:hypothetical protein
MSTAPTVQPPAPPPAEKPQLSQPQRILNTFIDPKKTFTDLNRGTAWWMAWVLMAIVSTIFTVTVDKKIGFDQVFQNNLKLASASQVERLEQMPPAQKDRMIAMQINVTKYISFGFPLISLVWLIIVALVLMLTFKFGAGAEVGFGKSLAVVVYASLPGIFRGLLAVVSIFMGKDPETFFIQSPAATNLGYFINPVEHKFLFSLGSSLDILMIWTLVLTAIGFSCVAKVKSGTSYAIVFGWYVVFSLAAAALGSAF